MDIAVMSGEFAFQLGQLARQFGMRCQEFPQSHKRPNNEYACLDSSWGIEYACPRDPADKHDRPVLGENAWRLASTTP